MKLKEELKKGTKRLIELSEDELDQVSGGKDLMIPGAETEKPITAIFADPGNAGGK